MNEQRQQQSIPANHVLAVLTGAGATESIREDLQRAGYEQTVLFAGEEISGQVDPKGEHSGLIAKALRSVQDHLSEQPNYLAQYEEEARSGNLVIAVPVEDRDQAEDVRIILEQHGARNLRHFGTLAVTDLTPDSNPSTRSADSPEKLSEC
jgi:hypothetical protein